MNQNLAGRDVALFSYNRRQISVDLVQILTDVNSGRFVFHWMAYIVSSRLTKLLSNWWRVSKPYKDSPTPAPHPPPPDAVTSEMNCQCDSQLTKTNHFRYAFHFMVKIVDKLLQNDAKKTSYSMRNTLINFMMTLTHWNDYRITYPVSEESIGHHGFLWQSDSNREHWCFLCCQSGPRSSGRCLQTLWHSWHVIVMSHTHVYAFTTPNKGKHRRSFRHCYRLISTSWYHLRIFKHNVIDTHTHLWPFYWYGLTLIPAWINDHILSQVWDEIANPPLNFNGCTVEV